MRPRLTCVVIGRDEGPRVGRALDSIRRALSSPGFDALGRGCQVLYVDSGSLDDSLAHAQAAEVECVSIARATASAARARNTGLQHAKAPWVQFLDADMVLDASWLPAALQRAQRDSLDGVGGRIVERLEGATLWSRAFGLDWNARGARGGPIGGAGLWRRTALEALGGFDESLREGEDPDLCRRMRAGGFRLESLERDMVLHELGLRGPREWWRRGVAVGRSAACIVARYRDPALAWQRFGQALLFLALLPLALAGGALWVGLLLAAVLALVARRAWLNRSQGMSLADACLHGLHVYAVKLPQLLGACQVAARSPGATNERSPRTGVLQ